MKKDYIFKIRLKCLICKKAFYVFPYRKKTAKYCSQKCLNKSKEGIVKTIFTEIKCLNCKRLFKVSTGNKEQAERRYCSVDCYRSKRSYGYYQKHRKCIYCGGFYYKGRQKGNFCSRDCFHKWAVGKFIPWNKNLKGIHLSLKSEFKPGKYHIFWKGGISKEPYPFEFTKELKSYIKHYYLCECQLCGKSEKLMVHHINYDKKNINLNNLIPLCKNCHPKTNYNREYWIKILNGKVVFDKIVKANNINHSFSKELIKKFKLKNYGHKNSLV